MSKYRNLVDYSKVLLFGIYIFVLPISHVTAAQSISLGLFVLLVLLSDCKNFVFKDILAIKNILFIFIGLLILSYFSLLYSVDTAQSFKEANSELLKNIIIMLFVFLYFKSLPEPLLEVYMRLIYISIAVHMLINIYIWHHFGFEFSVNTRMGGLLDGALEQGGGAGERFGIWATFFLAFALSLWYFSDKKFAILALFLALINIVANQTRATYVGVILIFMLLFTVMPKKRVTRALFFIILAISTVSFYKFSDNLSSRYNLTHVNEYMSLLNETPAKMRDYKEHGLDYSIATRLSMWKSALLYRMDEPFIPTGYGRSLYGKSITKLMDEQNRPFVVYSQVHNEFIGVFFSLGIFGLLLFLALWFYYFKMSIVLLRSDESRFKIFGFFSFFGGVGFVASLCFGSFFGDSEAKFFYLLFGMICAITYRKGVVDDKYLRA
ncbi:O-antigen ligase family protein [Campylobacter sp. RM16190]|uniref:O-antigen ligase family protein n=1 Tax=Campylobacter sp. RM16190 TaxID=1705727 RepID=UPI0014731D0E|nr:O-antigen ligase family protein [Campylobacter sp. RM16190]